MHVRNVSDDFLEVISELAVRLSNLPEYFLEVIFEFVLYLCI